MMADAAIETQNPTPCFISHGRTKKNSSVGKTSQNIPVESSATRAASFVSMYSHIIARSDVSGSARSSAAKVVYLFPSSEAPTITAAVRTVLTIM
jgi:hypothetical protein